MKSNGEGRIDLPTCTLYVRRLDIRRKMEVGNWTGRIYNMQGSPLNDARPVVLPDNLDGVLGRTLGKATMASNWYEWELEGEIGDGSRRTSARPIDLDTYYTCIGTW